MDPGGRIAILGTGGTIGNTKGGRIHIASLVEDIRAHSEAPVLSADRLVVEEAQRIAGSEMTTGHWLAIREHAQRLVDRPDVDGLVVTHGTFTVEETAFFLHLALSTTKPVVITCAQRLHGIVGSDGDRNLVDAVQLAASGVAANAGAVVVVGQEIHSARDIVKLSQRPNGFSSRDRGLLGTIDDDEIDIFRMPRRRHTAHSEFTGLGERSDLPRVDIACSYVGADAAAIEAFVVAGAEGIVLEGFPYSGKPTRPQAQALAQARDNGVAVVVANRGGYGRVPASQSEAWIGADTLTAAKARVVLMLALATNLGHDLARIYSEY